MAQDTAEIVVGIPIISRGALTMQARGLFIATHRDNRVLWPDRVHYVGHGTRQFGVRLGSQLVAAR